MKKLLIVLGGFVALLVAAYLVVTSSGFLKSVVLPRVGSALNARVEADSIALRPLASTVEIRRLTIVPNGAEPLATVDLARVRYQLGALIRGIVAVDEIHVGSPAVTVVAKADGTSNLDPILKQLATGAAPEPATPAEGAKPAQVDLRTLRIENGTASYRATAQDGGQTTADVTGLNVTLANIRNGASGRLDFGGGWAFQQRTGGATPAASGAQGAFKGGFDLGLSADLAPASVNGRAETQIQQATGSFTNFTSFEAVLSTELTPSELKQLTLQFQRGGTALGALSARGPLDLARQEGQLQVDITAIDREVLNLAGAASGLDFTTTRFDSTNRVELGAAGQRFAIRGGITGSRVAVKKGDLTMPPLDLRQTHDLVVDLAGGVANVQAFALTATQGGRAVVQGSLSRPLQVAFGNSATAGTVPDASVKLAVQDLRLADWSALLGTPMEGSVNATADVGVQGAGRDLAVDAVAALAGFSGTFGTNRVSNLGLQATAKLVVASFATPAQRRLNAQAEVRDLKGEAALVRFDRHGAAVKADIGLPENAVEIHGLDMVLRQGAQDGGALGVKGRWDTARGAGEITATARDFTETGLRPFLQAALGDKQLRSMLLNADVTAKVDPAADTSLRASATVTNLVVRDPSGTVPESPLAVGLNLDAGGSKSVLQVRQASLQLTPTARARNQVTLSGVVDYSKTNALKGDLKLAAESLDVTPYVDLFTSKPAAPAPATPPPAAPPATGPQTEPEPIVLPIDVFSLDTRIGKFFLREVAAENVVAVTRITGSRVQVAPMKLALNGAPIEGSLDLNLGVPGYQYDVKLKADHIPVAPIANSFVPLLKGRIEGAAVAGVDVKGAGVTGVNLKKNLSGGMNFAVTNANLKLTDQTQRRGILSILVNVLANTLNIRELKDQPIMDIVADAKMGNGRIELAKANARSASLSVDVAGGIPIADDLMQSPLKFPVAVSLSRPVAEKAKLMPANTPTNALYVPLPPIVSMQGTLGAPEVEVDKVQAGLLAARGVGGLIGGTAGGTVGTVSDLIGGVTQGKSNAVGNLIQGIGGLFGPRTTNAPAGTNVPAATATPPSGTNAPAKDPIGGLLKNILGPKKEQ